MGNSYQAYQTYIPARRELATGSSTGASSTAAPSTRVIPSKGKTRITTYLDDEVLTTFRERAERTGVGYQTMINQALREYLAKTTAPLDESTLRRVLREELRLAG